MALRMFLVQYLLTEIAYTISNARRLVFVFIMPIGLANIGWKMYMVNASWDIVIVGLIVSSPSSGILHSLISCLKAFFWIETKGKTLEEIDVIFEGEKHSSVPDVEEVRLGKAEIDVGAINVQVEEKMKEL